MLLRTQPSAVTRPGRAGPSVHDTGRSAGNVPRESPFAGDGQRDGQRDGQTTYVTHPQRLVRTAVMLETMLGELHRLQLDRSCIAHLSSVHEHVLDSVREVVSDDLASEIELLGLALPPEPASEPQIHLAYGQLLGWLSGLLNGLQLSMLQQHLADETDVATQQRTQRDAERRREEASVARRYL